MAFSPENACYGVENTLLSALEFPVIETGPSGDFWQKGPILGHFGISETGFSANS
jgi:hypothetical protein